MAVEATRKILKEFAESLHRELGKNPAYRDMLLSVRTQRQIIQRIILCVLDEWHRQVETDLEQNPLSDEELKQCGEWEIAYREGRELFHVYGTTLIAALSMDDLLIMFHQGDGRCLLVRDNGSMEEPVPWDSRCIGNLCTSLCEADAAESFRYRVLDLREINMAAVIAATDGVEDSFPDMQATWLYLADLACRMTLSEDDGGDTESACRKLEEELGELSISGSQDDISVVGMVSPENMEKIAKRLSLLWLRESNLAEERKLRTELSGMQRKKNYLDRQAEEADSVIRSLIGKREDAVQKECDYISGPEQVREKTESPENSMEEHPDPQQITDVQTDEAMNRKAILTEEREAFLKKYNSILEEAENAAQRAAEAEEELKKYDLMNAGMKSPDQDDEKPEISEQTKISDGSAVTWEPGCAIGLTSDFPWNQDEIG